MESFDSVFAGVGGQGILLAAEIVGTAALRAGFNVRVSELHGMAQRGGAVVSHVRVGETAFAPTVMEGTADVILGFEPMEALRSIKFASKKTVVLTNTTPSKIGGSVYPSVTEIFEQIRHFTENIISVDADAIAQRVGTVLVQNVVMVGALAATGTLPIGGRHYSDAIKDLVPARYLSVNMEAFDSGFKAVKI
jgi:indolepyruvate ferredoxin oxidoreductase beta subunit